MKTLIVCKHPEDADDSKICKIIENIPGLEIEYSWKNTLTKKHLKNIDLVISIGGDGTTLSASHFLIDTPILAINSNPEKSVGALTTITSEKVEEKIKQILSDNFKEEKLERIETFINNKQIPLLALNDVFIANKKAYLISKYKLKFKNKEEIQMSSGLLFSTGTGSTAWFKSSGGEPFSPQSRFIKTITREPYKGFGKVVKHYALLKETIHEDEYIEITPLVPSVLAIDSIREYSLKPLDKVKIKISEHPLRRII